MLRGFRTNQAGNGGGADKFLIKDGIERYHGVGSGNGISGYFNSRFSPIKQDIEGYVQLLYGDNQWTAGGTYYYPTPIDLTKYKGIKLTYQEYAVGAVSDLRTGICWYTSIPTGDLALSNVMQVQHSSVDYTTEYYFGADTGNAYLIFALFNSLSSVSGGSRGVFKIRTIELIPR